LDTNADVDAQTSSDQATALMRAAFAGHVDTVQLLLKSRADVSLQDSRGRTALHKVSAVLTRRLCSSLMNRHQAVEGKSPAVARLLLAHFDSISAIQDGKGYRAVDLARLDVACAELFRGVFATVDDF
jgi:ankyrin repeat protein